jgi:alkylation response protein AidB-like acyl-CoA dehydrogenase
MSALEDSLHALRAVATGPADAAWPPDAIAEALSAFHDFATAAIAPVNEIADREGCRIEAGRVRLPAAMTALYADYRSLGWQGLALPVAQGGAGAPPILAAAATEATSRACHAFQMLVGLVPGAIAVIDAFGTEAQKSAHIPGLVSGQTLATMALTEPQAGSDLAAIRTTATRTPDGGWALNGEKIFISGGDQDMSEAILHLVLARTGAPGSGTRGLSLFLCPGPGVRLLRIEEKLGLHGSPTCHLAFDAAGAELLGVEGEGLVAMFTMMNHARLDVALQGVGHAGAAQALAADYAANRLQGRDASGAAMAIAGHGDVARMLALMDAMTLGARAMAYRTADSLHDTALADFLTPVIKAFCTETATTVADLGIQVLGGYGYLPEYGMERIWRDARITRLYEGTNGILAMTLAKRLLVGKGADNAAAFRAELDAALALPLPSPARDHLAATIARWQETAAAVAARSDPGPVADAFMRLTGLTFFAACWARLEAAASDAPDPGRITRLADFVRRHLLAETLTHAARCHQTEPSS